MHRSPGKTPSWKTCGRWGRHFLEPNPEESSASCDSFFQHEDTKNHEGTRRGIAATKGHPFTKAGVAPLSCLLSNQQLQQEQRHALIFTAARLVCHWDPCGLGPDSLSRHLADAGQPVRDRTLPWLLQSP